MRIASGLGLVVAFFLGSQSLTAQPVLIHHFQLEESSGLTALDSVTANSALLKGFDTNDDSQWVDGFIGGGLLLGADATLDNYLEFSLDAVTSGFTVAMWVKPGAAIAGEGEFTLFENGEIGFNLITNPNAEGGDFERLLLYWDTSFPNLTVGSTTLNPGRWYHVALTSAGLGGAKSYYVNGVLETPQFFAPSEGGDGSATVSGWTAGTLGRIGALDGGGRAHDSIVDDVRIYSGVLSVGEIQALIPSIPNVPPGLSDVSPAAGSGFNVPGDGFRFTASAVDDAATLSPAGIRVIVNAVDVSGDLTIGGTPTAREVSYDLLASDTLYDVEITVTDSNGESTVRLHEFGTYAPGPRPPGLLYHFRLDETVGLLTLDPVGGRVGRLNGFVSPPDSQWVDGVVDGALDLLPDPGNVSFTLSQGVDTLDTGGFTIALWVKPGEEIVGGVDSEWTLFDGGGLGFNIRSLPEFQGQTQDRVLLFWDGNFDNLEVGTTPLEAGNWYHVAIVSRGPGGQKTFYLNGQLEPDRLFAPQNGGIGLGSDNGWPAGTVATIGGQRGGERTHDSTLDDLRIYDRPLSPAEIAALADRDPGVAFVRADANGDGSVNIADPSFDANFVFGVGSATTPRCLDAADANGDAAVNIADVSFIANFVFGVGSASPPPPPGAVCGSVALALGCESPPAACNP